MTIRLLTVPGASPTKNTPFEADYLSPNPANYIPLTPLSLLKRTAEVYPTESAYVDCHLLHLPPEVHTTSWGEMYKRVKRLAHALKTVFQMSKNDVVSMIAPNNYSILEAHFAVPGCSAILHTINTRLDAVTIAYQLQHSQPVLVLVDYEFTEVMSSAAKILQSQGAPLPKFVLIANHTEVVQHDMPRPLLPALYETDYESLIEKGDERFELEHVSDENNAITLNYTSGTLSSLTPALDPFNARSLTEGTTGNPKGVVTSHRGAYLNAISNNLEWNMPRFSHYLWVVPMFHCNGWCFPWALAACAGTSYLIRQVRAEIMFDVINRCPPPPHRPSLHPGRP